MKFMKRIIFLTVVIFLSVGINAQFFYSNNQQIIKDIVTNSFVVVEQSYQLEDTVNHQLFGRNNQPEFGKLRGFAVKTKEGYIVSNNLLAPWTVDENCRRYLNQYKGKISKTSIFEILDTVTSPRSIISYSAHNQNCLLSLVNDTVFQNNGFSIFQGIGKTEGWLVWLTAKSDIEAMKSGDEVSYQIYKKELEIASDSVCYDVANPTTENKIIGGLYIVPGLSKIGYVEFELCGIMVNVEDSWKIALCRFDIVPSPSNITGQQVVDLTPILPVESQKKSKKAKKIKRNRDNE